MQKIFVAVLLLLSIPSHSYADSLQVGDLSNEYCSLNDSQDYWYRRVPPYVGYSKGERTTAGGDGTCVLGFPKGGDKSGYVLVSDKIIEVFPVTSKGKDRVYSSKDRQTRVQISITGNETTCEPDADKCCGDYTYAKISVEHGGKNITVKAVSYSGG